MVKSSNPIITDPNDPKYDPNKDPLFDENAPASPPDDTSKLDNPDGSPGHGNYKGSGMTAAENEAKYGRNPDGTPKTEAEVAEETPSCPPVSAADYPFDTVTIPAGCNAPLSDECAAYYNAKYAPEATKAESDKATLFGAP